MKLTISPQPIGPNLSTVGCGDYGGDWAIAWFTIESDDRTGRHVRSVNPIIISLQPLWPPFR